VTIMATIAFIIQREDPGEGDLQTR
jgi:hypothetical protein